MKTYEPDSSAHTVSPTLYLLSNHPGETKGRRQTHSDMTEVLWLKEEAISLLNNLIGLLSIQDAFKKQFA